MKAQGLIKLAAFYDEFFIRNRDSTKANVRWWKTKWGIKDNYERK